MNFAELEILDVQFSTFRSFREPRGVAMTLFFKRNMDKFVERMSVYNSGLAFLPERKLPISVWLSVLIFINQIITKLLDRLLSDLICILGISCRW